MPKAQYILSDAGDAHSRSAELQRILDDIAARLNYMTPEGDDIAFSGKKITNLATGEESDDAVRKDQIFLLNQLSSVILGFVNRITITDNGNDTITISTPQDLDTDADVEFNSLNIINLLNSAGSLKIQEAAEGNVDLFSGTDVDDAADGKKFSVTRRAAEGDTTLYIYGKNDTSVQIQSTQDLEISSSTASGVISIGTVSTNVVRLVGEYNSIGKGTGTDNLPLRHYGYITAGGLSGQKYVQWLLDDTDDYFHLTRQTDLILGLKVEMPVQIGDDTDNASFDADGQLTLNGTGRVYQNEWINPSGFSVPGIKPAIQVDWGIACGWEFTDGTDDTIYATIRIPIDMDRTVAPELKIGWASATVDPGDDSKQVVWQLEYLYVTAGESTAAAAQETLTTTTSASTTANGLTISTITGIDLPATGDQLLMIRIKRLGADAADTLGDDCTLLGVGLKYVMDKLGTAL